MTQFITEQEAMERLNDPSNLANMFGSPIPSSDSYPLEPVPSATDGIPERFVDAVVDRVISPAKVVKRLQPFERVLIGVSAHTNSRADVAAAFGVHPTTVARLEKGQDVHTRQEDPKLKKVIDANVKAINDVAVDRLLKVMGAISDTKIDEIKTAREAASVAKDIATVIEKTTPKQAGGNANAQVIIMSPSPAMMSSYTVKEAPIPDA